MLVLGFFLSPVKTEGFEEKYIIRVITSDNTVHDKWFGTIYERDGRNNDTLKVGGWGDIYYSFIKIPVDLRVPGTDRIILNKATMNLHSMDSENPTAMRKWFIRSPWSESSTTDHWGTTVNPQGTLAAPSPNSLYSFDITQEYYAWITGAEPNHGIALSPLSADNNFNYFRSSENKLEVRPYIEVSYERLPRFKMPLAGGKAWKLTVETGGKSYDGIDDTFHTGNTYYSLDFSPRWKPLTGGPEQLAIDPPVYAVAGGVVVGNGQSALNGWFIKIDHDYDTKLETGFQSICIHLESQSPLAVGARVNQGDVIGTMGKTGTDDVHLHITFYFKNHAGTSPNGFDASPELNVVRMENRLLKDYNLNTTWDSNQGQYTPIYYQSTNTQ